MSNILIPLNELHKPEQILKYESKVLEALIETPENPDVYIIWSLIQLHKGNLEEALKYAKIGIGFQPTFAGHYVTLSAIYNALGDSEKSYELLEFAANLSSHVPSVNWNLSLALLERGKEWARAWNLYRWRRIHLPGQLRTVLPEWNGDNPKTPDVKLLIWCEQGLGDIVMMFRFVKEVAVNFNFGEIALEVPDELYTLFCRHTEGIDQIYVRRADFHTEFPFDYHCSIMDLPYLLGIDNPEFVDSKPYLTPSPLSITQWETTITENKLEGSNIGICWYGSTGHANNLKRSAALSDFESLKELGNIFAVQKDQHDIPEFDVPEGFPLLNPTQGMVNADFTSGLLATLDYVVTIDSFIAHLAGALGVKTYLILPEVSEWRWQGGKGKCIWYDSVEMFKQNPGETYKSVIERVTAAIKQDQINHTINETKDLDELYKESETFIVYDSKIQ